MLRSLISKFKRGNQNSNPRDNKEDKKKIIKEWTTKIGISWSDIENLLFWKDPRVSLAVFIILTGFFWKFISYKLQRLGLLIIAAAVPCSFPETRTYIGRYFSEKFHLKLKPERRSLGFDVNDVYEFLVDCWVKYEQHYIYLLHLKSTSVVKFYLVTISYISLLVLVTTCLPLAGMIYLCGTILYFCPILSYLDLYNILSKQIERLVRPVYTHWTFSQTKRRRNRSRKTVRRGKHRASLSDIETEEFIPARNKDCETVLAESIVERKHSSEADDLDEFQLRGDFVRQAEDFSSENEEEPFLPSYSYQVPDEMPSLSAFDSMMEPLDDDFQRGLDFRNMTVASNNNSNFGLPDNYVDEDVTSEDIDDIPFEDEVQRKVSNERHFLPSRDTTREPHHGGEKQQHGGGEQLRDVYDYSDSDSVEFDVDQEFEFLDRTELYNVTDEEIMEQNIGGHSHSESVAPNSNILGY